MNVDLLNIYIEKLLNEVSEGVKSRILLETKLKYTENLNLELQRQIEEIKNEFEGYKSKQENINKRRKQKEVDTSSDNF